MLILHNAKIYTMDSSLPDVAALGIEHGRVVAWGKSDAILAEFPKGRRTEHQNLEGKTVIPGLIDAHLHMEHYALGRQAVDCETPSRAECLRRVAERAKTTPAGEWVLGHGWNQNLWPDGFGSAADLDAAVPNNPVYLTAKSLHAAWANTAALRAAGLDRNSPDPTGGRLGRAETGELDGILFESAMGLVGEAVPEPTLAKVTAAIEAAQEELWSLGVVGIHDFDRKRCFMALQVLHAAGKLCLRVIKSIPLEDLPSAASLGLRTGFGDDYLRIGSVKLFADGALGPQTAAMLQPYEDNPENRGMLMLDSEELFETGVTAAQSGLSLAIHAIGDRANHEVLNGLEQLRRYEQAEGLPALRHRIEHVQVIHPDDQARLAALDVIASMQPVHATSDMDMSDRFWGERSTLAYAWRTQFQHGARLAFGSDAPVESPNPFWGLHAALTRRRREGDDRPNGWYPEQRLSMAEALHGFTVGAAYAAGMEGRQGKLAPGFLADLLVLPADPFEIEAEQVKDLRPLATMVGGQWVCQV